MSAPPHGQLQALKAGEAYQWCMSSSGGLDTKLAGGAASRLHFPDQAQLCAGQDAYGAPAASSLSP